MPRCVLDASVYIDLNWAGLIPALMALPIEFVMVDLVRGEASHPDDVPEAESISVRSLSGAQVGQVYEMEQQPWASTLSVKDLLSFQLAKDEGCLLLANDKALRRFASSRGVQVHGSLWVLDELIRCGRLTSSEAADALEVMRAHGARFPKKECEQRLREWRRAQEKGGEKNAEEGYDEVGRSNCFAASV